MWWILTFYFFLLWRERVLDTQKRRRLVSCVSCPEWAYFCFLSNFYFDVYEDVFRDQPSARLAQRYTSREPLVGKVGKVGNGVCVW
jgi:hypothetical protein